LAGGRRVRAICVGWFSTRHRQCQQGVQSGTDRRCQRANHSPAAGPQEFNVASRMQDSAWQARILDACRAAPSVTPEVGWQQLPWAPGWRCPAPD
jgi:hypothetical protein